MSEKTILYTACKKLASYPNEQWKTLDEYPDYDISNLGRVKSYVANPRIITGNKDKRTGYWYVGLNHKAEGQIRWIKHRLIAHAFLGPCPEDKEVNHIDADKQNNAVSNLEYVTHFENMQHAKENNLMFTGRKSGCKPSIVEVFPLTQLTQYQADTARVLYFEGITESRLVELYRCTPECMANALEILKLKAA